MSGALAGRSVDKEAEKGRVEQTKVRRYWAGKAPEWAAEQVSELQIGERDVSRTDVAAPVIVKKADPRLARLAAKRTDDIDARLEERREIRAAEIVRRRRADDEQEDDQARGARRDRSDSEPAPSGDDEEPDDLPTKKQPVHEEEDDEEALKRRQAVRERLLQQQRQAEAMQPEQEEDEEEEEDESEYETDSEDEAYGRRLLKPVFVPKQARETIAERDRMEQEEEALREYEKKREEERKAEAREVVKATIAAEEAAAKAAAEDALKGSNNVEDVDTDDDLDEQAEFEAWKMREMMRIKISRDEREKQAREAAERERLRTMTDEERRAWELANPKQQPVKDKQKWKFLQKYWHKGAFFQEGADDVRGTTGKEDIFNRDYSAPTGEDKFNKEILPKVMQVRNFGRSGRTKWSHLLAEDTTQSQEPALLQASADRKRYGLGEQDFAKPKKFRT